MFSIGLFQSRLKAHTKVQISEEDQEKSTTLIGLLSSNRMVTFVQLYFTGQM